MSSYTPGSVPPDWTRHPVHKFIEDDINYSISTDDPTVTGKWRHEELKMMVNEFGLTPSQLTRANFRAARAAFLRPEEREDLVKHLKVCCGAEVIRGSFKLVNL